MSSFSHELAAAIRRRRITLGLSQEELADRAGLHRTYISMVERGVRNITVVVLDRIARALGVRGSVILSEVERHRAGSA